MTLEPSAYAAARSTRWSTSTDRWGAGTNLAIAEGLILGARATALRPALDIQPGQCCVAFLPNTGR